jgi:hypothetical protein
MAPVSSMVTGEGASAYAAGSQVWKGTSGTLTAKPASTPMASQGITAPRCAVTICDSAPDAAIAVRSPKSIEPVERKIARNESSSATEPAMV